MSDIILVVISFILTSILFAIKAIRRYIFNKFGIYDAVAKRNKKLNFETLLSYPVILFFSVVPIILVYTCINITLTALLYDLELVPYVLIIIIVVPFVVKNVLKLIIKVSSSE